jgi:4-amino-4-deoxy-L-arabinose transferase-like glycosyltransferase
VNFPFVRRRTLAGLAAIALIVRVGYVVAFMRGYAPDSDAHSYYRIGQAVAEGRGYSFTLPFEFAHATAIRPPLYPTLLAGVFRMFGVHIGVAQAVNILAGTAVVVLGALLAQRIGGTRAGWCAGLVLACYPPLLANDATLLVESTAVLLLFASVLLLVDGRTILAGGTLGLLMLDRASAQWLVVVIAVWVGSRVGWMHALRLVAVAGLVIAPWVVRNAVHVGGPVLVATNGFNLNAVYSGESHESGGWVDAYFDPRFAVTRTEARDEVDLDALLRAHAVEAIRRDPTVVLRVARMNAERWLELHPSWNRNAERLDGRNLTVRDWTLPAFYVVTLLGGGALLRARRSPAAHLLVIAAGYFTAVSLLSIAVPRLRSVCDASMAVGAGVAIAWVIDHRWNVDLRPPPVRLVHRARSAVAIGTAALVVAGAAYAWRAQVRARANQTVAVAVARNASAIDAILADYRTSTSAHRPPRFAPADLDRARRLRGSLGNAAADLDGSSRERVAAALRAVRILVHETEVIALLSAGEYFDAAHDRRPPSLAAVRRFYEELRKTDWTLSDWDTATGRVLQQAREALAVLRAAS